VYAATASVGESYQPGIGDVLLRFGPNVIVLMVVGTPLAATFVPQIRAAASQMAQTMARIALATAATVLFGLLALEWLAPCRAPRPPNRDLRSTLEHSLLCPELSNRSYSVPIFAGGLSGLFLWAANRRKGGAQRLNGRDDR
jgi:hypothetical protein